MRKRIKQVWNAIRQILSVRGLLQWIGFWHYLPTVATLLVSALFSWWARLRGLSSPNIILLFVGTFSFLTVIGAAVLQVMGRGIGLSMRILRSTIMAESWVRPLVDNLYHVNGKPSPKADFDYLCEIVLVNQSKTPLTLQTFAAQIKINGRENWEPMKVLRDLSEYQTKVGDDSTSRQNLSNLLVQVENVPLMTGIGYRGWLGFRVQSTSDELSKPALVEVTATDASGRKHETVLALEEGFEDEVVYSIKRMRN